MPVYNGASYLSAAVQSILRQTFTDFEFLIIDDGSTDDSVAIIGCFDDSRIRLVRNGKNLGLVASLNRGLDLARGEYVARMDADDISRPARLAKQVRFMDDNPQVGVCGSWIRYIPSHHIWKLPRGNEEIKCWQFHTVGVAHPAVMLRRNLFVRNGLYYDPAYLYIEDFELWGRALKYMKFANIQEVLLDYRISHGQVCSRHLAEQLETVIKLRTELLGELGIFPTAAEQDLHEAIMNCQIPPDKDFIDRTEQWLLLLGGANKAAGKYEVGIFTKRLFEIWFSVCVTLADTGNCSWKRCRNSLLWSEANVSVWNGMRALGAWITHKGLWSRHEHR